MDDFRLKIFLSEIETQCQFVQLAANELDSLLKAPVGLAQPADTKRIWNALQTILVSAANISKLLWGSKSEDEEPRKPVRDAIGIDDRSPLRSKRVRNA